MIMIMIIIILDENSFILGSTTLRYQLGPSIARTILAAIGAKSL